MSKVEETIRKYNLFPEMQAIGKGAFMADLQEIKAEQEELQKKADAYDEQSKPVEIPAYVAEWADICTEHKALPANYFSSFISNTIHRTIVIPRKITDWFVESGENQEQFIQGMKHGYTVKQEREWIVDIGGMYLKEPLGDTSDFTIKMTWNREYAYKFDDWNIARENISVLGGKITPAEEEQE